MAHHGNETRRRVRLLGVVGAACLGSVLLTSAGATAQDKPPTLPPLQVVVLVDESGSISDADVAEEKKAARTIALSVLPSSSVVSVAGFGSSNGQGQSAVHVVCPRTVIDEPQKRDFLATCVDGLHPRSKEEGDGTDHTAALQQALDSVNAGGPDKKIVFLLTDGKLDVSESPQWGDTPERRNAAAAAKAKEVLADLDTAGAQVWPLGFGNIDQDALGGFARGKSCTPGTSSPQTRVIGTSAELTKAVHDAFISASCVKGKEPVTGRLPEGGGSIDLTIDIPTIASDVSILVYKGDSRVQVEYKARNADKPAPAAGGKKFDFAGQTTETESLRITDPEPGPWNIHLSSANLPAQDVAVYVVYQAAVKANLTVSPPQPAAGQAVDVNMQVWARDQAVTDQQALQELTFVTTLTGSSGFPPQQVTLSDPDHDGTFTGPLKVPDGASGDLTFTGEVTGIGIGGDTRVLSTKVLTGAAKIQAQILFDTNRAAATPGGTVSGSVSVTNNSGQPARLRLQVADPSPGTALTVDPAIVQAGSGVSTTQFTLRFGADSAIGASAATLRLVDDANPNVVVAQRLFAAEVAPEPGLLEKLFWLWVALAVLVIGLLAFLLAKLRSRNEARKVRGLKAQLFQGGFGVSELEPRDPNSKIFRFVVHQEFTGFQLLHAGPGDANVYEVRRAGPNISLTPSGQRPPILAPGERREVGQDLAVGILDERGLTAAGGPISGPVPEVSFSPFGSPVPGGPTSAPPSGSGSYGDPFAGAAAPGPPAQSPYTDPFASSYGDPFAGSATPQAQTATYTTPTHPTPGPGRPGQDPYQGDPFGDASFGGDSPGGRQPTDPSRRGPGASPQPPANDTYIDPNNPFG